MGVQLDEKKVAVAKLQIFGEAVLDKIVAYLKELPDQKETITFDEEDLTVEELIFEIEHRTAIGMDYAVWFVENALLNEGLETEIDEGDLQKKKIDRILKVVRKSVRQQQPTFVVLNAAHPVPNSVGVKIVDYAVKLAFIAAITTLLIKHWL